MRAASPPRCMPASRALRIAMPMNLGRQLPRPGPHARQPGRHREGRGDLGRGAAAHGAPGGLFLFGRDFTIPDAMYAPAVARFLTWQPELTEDDSALLRRGARASAGGAPVRRGGARAGGMAAGEIREPGG